MRIGNIEDCSLEEERRKSSGIVKQISYDGATTQVGGVVESILIYLLLADDRSLVDLT